MINQRTIKNNMKSSASKTKDTCFQNLRQLNDRDKKEILKKRERIEVYVPP